MSFYIRLNKSVMTFDGLISAYVCFLKMARGERGRREWRTSTDPQGGHSRELLVGPSVAGTQTMSSIHPNFQWMFSFYKCQHPLLGFWAASAGSQLWAAHAQVIYDAI